MSDKQKYPILFAGAVAADLIRALKPHCERIGIAGSIRRGKRFVSDAEILFIPKFELRASTSNFFDTDTVNLADACLESMLAKGELAKRANRKGGFAWGPVNKLGRHVASGIPVDFFSTSFEDWWVSLVIRTGSLETNLKLTQGAQARGRTLHAYGSGVEINSSGTILKAESERAVFDLCGVPFLPPEER